MRHFHSGIIISSCNGLQHAEHKPIIRVSAELLLETWEMKCIAMQISKTSKSPQTRVNDIENSLSGVHRAMFMPT